eukprot:GHVU01133654.1.p4 GENE.GHVU01133654.1~~GHVU01133654.1.p4  ORF type:complete len:100 (+),score=6.35 GHVU01133654.1:358-657(+)
MSNARASEEGEGSVRDVIPADRRVRGQGANGSGPTDKRTRRQTHMCAKRRADIVLKCVNQGCKKCVNPRSGGQLRCEQGALSECLQRKVAFKYADLRHG